MLSKKSSLGFVNSAHFLLVVGAGCGDEREHLRNDIDQGAENWGIFHEFLGVPLPCWWGKEVRLTE